MFLATCMPPMSMTMSLFGGQDGRHHLPLARLAIRGCNLGCVVNKALDDTSRLRASGLVWSVVRHDDNLDNVTLEEELVGVPQLDQRIVLLTPGSDTQLLDSRRLAQLCSPPHRLPRSRELRILRSLFEIWLWLCYTFWKQLPHGRRRLRRHLLERDLALSG